MNNTFNEDIINKTDNVYLLSDTALVSEAVDIFHVMQKQTL